MFNPRAASDREMNVIILRRVFWQPHALCSAPAGRQLRRDRSSFVQEAEPAVEGGRTPPNRAIDQLEFVVGQDREGRTTSDWLLAPTNEVIERRLLHCGSLEVALVRHRKYEVRAKRTFEPCALLLFGAFNRSYVTEDSARRPCGVWVNL